jgi:uncharacterized membrane protein YphA (DoxX/SURF4 family)
VSVQRLFSTFANGLPGLGLLLQRVVTGAALICLAVTHLSESPGGSALTLCLIGSGAGIFLMVGLWTPVVGVAIAFLQTWAFLSGAPDPAIALLIAALGVSLSLIGPGAWSIDARIFGRKQISVPQRQEH